MIKLVVEDYCQECRLFEPMIKSRPGCLFAEGEVAEVEGDVVVVCHYSDHCEYVTKLVKGEMKND